MKVFSLTDFQGKILQKFYRKEFQIRLPRRIWIYIQNYFRGVHYVNRGQESNANVPLKAYVFSQIPDQPFFLFLSWGLVSTKFFCLLRINYSIKRFTAYMFLLYFNMQG